MNLGPPFTHIVLDVEDKRLLAKVSVYDLAWSLKPHSGVQVGLEDIRSKTIQVKTDSFCIVHSILSISKLNQKVELNRVVFQTSYLGVQLHKKLHNLKTIIICMLFIS